MAPISDTQFVPVSTTPAMPAAAPASRTPSPSASPGVDKAINDLTAAEARCLAAENGILAAQKALEQAMAESHSALEAKATSPNLTSLEIMPSDAPQLAVARRLIYGTTRWYNNGPDSPDLLE